MDLDDAMAMFGFTREELEAELEAEVLLCDGCGRHIPCRHCRPLSDDGPDCA